MRRLYTYLIMLVCAAAVAQGQTYNQMDPSGRITQRNEYGGNFNPNNRDSVFGGSDKEVPYRVYGWRIDRRFGDIIPTAPDTLPHLYQNTIYNTGIYGEYNTLGTNYTPRLSRVFIDRPEISEFYFTQPYSFTTVEPDQFLFLNTLSPFTNIRYETCGNKQNGEDHFKALFAVNANRNSGLGFDLDYHYTTGYFADQSTSHFRTSLYGYYTGDRYQLHVLGTLYHRKATESGGILDDNLITHPESTEEQYEEDEIPNVLDENWNRTNSQHVLLSHRYNIGFYRKVQMTDEELKAREFAKKSAEQKAEREADMRSGRDGDRRMTPLKDSKAPMGRPKDARIMGDEPVAGDTGKPADRIVVPTDAVADSLKRAKEQEDSLEATLKKEFVPVTSLIHTVEVNNYDHIYQAYRRPSDSYYLNGYYNTNYQGTYGGDSIYDKTKYLSVKNTVALALLEGFNKYIQAGAKAFVSYEYRRYEMADTVPGTTASYLSRETGHCLNIGGQLSRHQGRLFHFDLAAELGITGYQAGSLAVDFSTDLNFPLFGDTVTLAAKAYFHRMQQGYLHEHFHSKHVWWDKDLEAETRTRIEGIFTYPKTLTQLRVAVDQISNYTYFGMDYNIAGSDEGYNRSGLTGSIYQEGGGINILTAQLTQTFRLGIINWENRLTYQNSSNQDVLPLPKLNLFSNLFLKFRLARVLGIELGGCLTYFTKYNAPDYLPLIGNFAVQRTEASRVELGGYPWIDVYANMSLKRARFFVAMSHVNAYSGNKMAFLTPHYPTNSRIFRFGVSWNFIN